MLRLCGGCVRLIGVTSDSVSAAAPQWFCDAVGSRPVESDIDVLGSDVFAGEVKRPIVRPTLLHERDCFVHELVTLIMIEVDAVGSALSFSASGNQVDSNSSTGKLVEG